MTIDERLEAITMNLELLSHEREKDNERIVRLVHAVEKLAEVAEVHERRLTRLEGNGN